MTTTSVQSEPELIPIRLAGRQLEIECQWIAPEATDADLLIFLHEGLGSASMWKDFPALLCRATGCRGLVFSRYGYGASTSRPAQEKWPVEFMHEQARQALPLLLDALGLQHERPILFGHSDGGSIALLYAAMYPDKVRAIIVAAPHILVEDISIASIQDARRAYLATDLPIRLARYHHDVDSAFWGWNDVWLAPAFRAWDIRSFLHDIRCPVLAIQGENDQYGTLEQVYGIKRIATQTELCIIADCGHSAHKDQPAQVIHATSQFIDKLN